MNGIELLARRRALGFSQAELAALIGVRQNTLSQWEAGTRSPRDPASVDELLASKEREVNLRCADLLLYLTDADTFTVSRNDRIGLTAAGRVVAALRSEGRNVEAVEV